MEVFASTGHITVLTMIPEQDERAAEIIGSEAALRHGLDLVLLLENKRAKRAEIHARRCRISVFVDKQAVDDAVNPVVVALLNQHGLSLAVLRRR